MSETEPFIIPTASKAKISRLLSFPLGAEEISVRLAGASQLANIQLHFHAGLGDGRSTFDEVLRVEYLNGVLPVEKWPIYSLYARPIQYRWEIVVHPVPRARRADTKLYLVKYALKEIEKWLLQRADMDAQGSDILAFFFDVDSSTGFAEHRLSKVEPPRKKV